MTDFTAIFGKPFAQQLAAWRIRLANQVPTATWQDLWQSQHDRAFVVAGAMKAELLADLAAAVDKAITNGGTLETFRKDFREIVEKNGWHGWAGEGSKKGEAWRTKVIYKTNLATSYAAGRLAQLREGGFTFYVYRHGGSVEPRIQHLAWDGLVLEADHPFWATHAPPNGWGCSCYMTGARSEEGAKRVGGKPGKTLEDGWQSIDPRTGAPVGIDKGWAYAPGASVSEVVTTLSRRLDVLPEAPSIALIRAWLQMDAFGNWMKEPVGVWPLARVSVDAADRIGTQTLVAKLSAESARKQMREHPELGALDYLMVQRVVDGATHAVQDGPQSLIYVLAEPGANGYVLVVKATVSGKELFVTSFRRLSADQVRRDRQVSRLLRKGD